MSKLKQTKRYNSEDYFATGVDNFENGNFKRAMEFFQAAIEQNPNFEQGYLKLAEVYFSLNDERNAKKTLYRLLSINPENSHAHKLLKSSPKSSSLSIDKEETVNSEVIPTKSKAHYSVATTELSYPSGTQLDVNKTYFVDLSDGNRMCLELFTSYNYNLLTKENRCFGKVVSPPNNQRPKGNLKIPNSVVIKGNRVTITQISSNAFSFCNELISVEIPSTITTIGNYAFPDSALKRVTFLSEWPPKIELFTFGGHQTNIQFFVPRHYIQNYKKYLPRYTLIPF